MPIEPTEDFLLIMWLIIGFIALGAVMAWAIRRNRGIERKRDRTEHRHMDDESAYRR
jgi:hypothetical protein